MIREVQMILIVLQSHCWNNIMILQGAEAGKMPDGQIMFSPRLGIHYDLNGDNTTILRGGLGIFTSRIPYVWPGGAYVNNGLTIGGLDEGDISGDISFRPDINNQYTDANFSTPSGQVDLFVADFKFHNCLEQV